jgi:hypothetical protein
MLQVDMRAALTKGPESHLAGDLRLSLRKNIRHAEY